MKDSLRALVSQKQMENPNLSLDEVVASLVQSPIKTATVMTPGPYLYEEGGKVNMLYKREADVAKVAAAEKDNFLPVMDVHDGKEITGIAYGFGIENGKLVAKLAAPVKSGDGVSPGFLTREIECEFGTCQTEMRLEHVAASASLEPRGSNNRVDGTMVEDKERLDALQADLAKSKADNEALANDVAAYKLRADALETAEKERLTVELRVRNDSFDYTTRSLDELKVLKTFLDGVKVPAGGVKAALDGIYSTVEQRKGSF